MSKVFLSLHVIAAILAIGPVAVAASMFPPALRKAKEDPASLPALRNLNRICQVYAGIGIAVPLFGFITASTMNVLGDGWLIVSIVLTAFAAAVLALLILPRQAAALALVNGDAAADVGASAARLAMFTGVFNLLWTVVTVLMIVRPGSSTGA
ncbi:DUF2269 family protein [Spirillospora sp. NPDC047279]|uniref:DUF2269 family protein n=1 Tax=Spirillospora sp. NPDC047279 TaxID=3155478 RepID=UPI0033D2A3EB